MVSIGIFIYAATSPLNGYFGGSLYARMGGEIAPAVSKVVVVVVEVVVVVVVVVVVIA